jgi:hypothetical protein
MNTNGGKKLVRVCVCVQAHSFLNVLVNSKRGREPGTNDTKERMIQKNFSSFFLSIEKE